MLSAGKRRLNPPALVVAGGLPGLTAADHEFVRVGGWFAAHAGFGGDAFRCCWSLPILSFDLGVLICSRLIRDGQFSRIVEFSPQQRHCVWGQASPPKLGVNFFVNGAGVARVWELGGHYPMPMSTLTRLEFVLRCWAEDNFLP